MAYQIELFLQSEMNIKCCMLSLLLEALQKNRCLQIPNYSLVTNFNSTVFELELPPFSLQQIKIPIDKW